MGEQRLHFVAQRIVFAADGCHKRMPLARVHCQSPLAELLDLAPTFSGIASQTGSFYGQFG
jgi:hypothetical protein